MTRVALLAVLALAGCAPDLAAAKTHLRSAIEDSQEDLDACYAKTIAADASATGDLAMVLHVQADGRVASAKVASTDVDDPKLAKCIKAALLEVRVKPVPAAEFDIDYTFQLGGTAKPKAKPTGDDDDDGDKPKPKPKGKAKDPADADGDDE